MKDKPSEYVVVETEGISERGGKTDKLMCEGENPLKNHRHIPWSDIFFRY